MRRNRKKEKEKENDDTKQKSCVTHNIIQESRLVLEGVLRSAFHKGRDRHAPGPLVVALAKELLDNIRSPFVVNRQLLRGVSNITEFNHRLENKGETFVPNVLKLSKRIGGSSQIVSRIRILDNTPGIQCHDDDTYTMS